eukprot:GDKJ01028936.1.p1 GENE.GDKJ01028936.1~~GDKJ01028936.1.p1  ORF type:complete len:814 (-),score=167.54 GDKJ01028936.1:185-2626(-)
MNSIFQNNIDGSETNRKTMTNLDQMANSFQKIDLDAEILKNDFSHQPAVTSIPHNMLNESTHVLHRDSNKRKPRRSQLYTIQTNPFENLPPLLDVEPDNRVDVFCQKLRACCTLFDPADYNDDEVDTVVKKARIDKQNTLLELIDCVNSMGIALFTEGSLRELLRMVAVNLFREMPPPEETSARLMALSVGGSFGVLEEEDETRLNPLFSVHGLFVYELFMKVIGHPDLDKKRFKRSLTNSYILRLFELFQSEDPRERDVVKSLIHKIYVHMTAIRVVIRRCIQNFFHRIAFEHGGARNNKCLALATGVSEILELYGSIATGLSVPLKQEHVQFLFSNLIPLHKVERLISFSPQLTFCISLFIKKDPTLLPQVLSAIIKYWSRSSASKQTLLLTEIDEILLSVYSSSIATPQAAVASLEDIARSDWDSPIPLAAILKERSDKMEEETVEDPQKNNNLSNNDSSKIQVQAKVEGDGNCDSSDFVKRLNSSMTEYHSTRNLPASSASTEQQHGNEEDASDALHQATDGSVLKRCGASAVSDPDPNDHVGLVLPCIEDLLKLLAASAEAEHSQTAERALYILNSTIIAKTIQSDCVRLLKLIIPALIRSSLSHWASSVHLLGMSLTKLILQPCPLEAAALVKRSLATILPLEIKNRIRWRHGWNAVSKAEAFDLIEHWFIFICRIGVEVPCVLTGVKSPSLPLDVVQQDFSAVIEQSNQQLVALERKDCCWSRGSAEEADFDGNGVLIKGGGWTKPLTLFGIDLHKVRRTSSDMLANGGVSKGEEEEEEEEYDEQRAALRARRYKVETPASTRRRR